MAKKKRKNNGIPSHVAFAQEKAAKNGQKGDKKATKLRNTPLLLVSLLFLLFSLLSVPAFHYGVFYSCGERPTSRPKTKKKWWAKLFKQKKTKEEAPPKDYCQVAWSVQESLVTLLGRVGLSGIIMIQQQQQTCRSEDMTESKKRRKSSPLIQRFKSLLLGSKTKNPSAGAPSEEETASSIDNKFHYSRADLLSAFSEQWIYTPHQKRIAMELNKRVRNALEQQRQIALHKKSLKEGDHHEHHHVHIPSVDERLSKVAWGGPEHSHYSQYVHWWNPPHHASLNPHQFDGSNLLAAYLRIMKFPEDLVSTFPFKLCSKEPHCPAEFALLHTLEWRETYKPWCVSPSSIQENQNGFVYARGYSPSIDDSNVGGGHSVVWFRASQGHVQDAVSYFRAVLQSLELAVADSLHRTKGTIGKFNFILDAQGVHMNMLPSLGETKKAIVMLQDHFPDRLGMVFLANLSRAEEFLVTLIKPLLTKEVRDKITVLPHNVERRLAMLQVAVEHEFIPDFLGGTDDFRFDPDTYYEKRHICSDAEAKQYLEEMPYHA